MPAFSIITICLNPGPAIETAVNSVLEQTFDDLEYIIVDGGSSDGTVQRIAAMLVDRHRFCAGKKVDAPGRQSRIFQSSFSRKTVHLFSERDHGLYDALNKGVRLATGSFVGIVHADDMLAHIGVLNKVVRHFAETGAAAVYGDLQYVRERVDGQFSVLRHWRSGSYDRRKLTWGWMPPHPALYVKKSAYDRAALAPGMFFDPSFSCSGDYDFILRLLSGHGVIPSYLPGVLVQMRTGGVSNRRLTSLWRKSVEDWRAIRSNRIGHLHTLAGKILRKLGQFATARRLSLGALLVGYYAF